MQEWPFTGGMTNGVGNQHGRRYTGLHGKEIKVVFALFSYIVGLLGTFALIVGVLMYIGVTVSNRRRGPVLVPAGILCGYVAGMLLVWSLIPREWTLSFWTTLAAAGNAEKYGHPAEHYAEGIVIGMMFGAVVGAFVGGFSSHAAGRLVRQRRAGGSADFA